MYKLAAHSPQWMTPFICMMSDVQACFLLSFSASRDTENNQPSLRAQE